jgi:hypothetical protein
VLLHRLEQRRLRARRRAVDLVGEDDVREDRPLDEAEGARPRRAVLLEDLRARHVARHQVGRELDAPEVEPHRLGHALHEQRLRQPRHADQPRVPPATMASRISSTTPPGRSRAARAARAAPPRPRGAGGRRRVGARPVPLPVATTEGVQGGSRRAVR